MKTIFYQLGDKIRALHVWTFLLLMLFSLSANAQRGGKGYKGVSNRNGMLVFTDSLAFQSVYQQLEAEIAAQDRNPNAKSGPVLVGECTDDNAVLANFEAQMGIASLRTKYLRQECEDLSKGLAPEQLTENPVPDEILSAFLNEKGEMQVGQVLYWVPSITTYFRIPDGDMNALRGLQAGTNPGLLPNVEVHNNLDFSADYRVEYLSGNTVQFTYTGPQVRGMSFLWNFGDGTTSTVQNPRHSFRDGKGEHKVSLTVSIPSQNKDLGNAIKDVIQIIHVILELSDCYPYFSYQETGVPGEICFSPGIVGDHTIVSYFWEFGDGTTSTEATPCHTYICDKTFYVKLTTTTADSCTHTFPPNIPFLPGFPVAVDSYTCCARSASTNGTKYYSDNKRKIKYKQGQFGFFPFFTKITTKMSNYKKVFGIWVKTKADMLRLQRIGNDFTNSPEGCHCDVPYDISATKTVYNKRSIKMNETIWDGSLRISYDAPWLVKYTVDYNLLLTKTTPVTCD